MQKSIGNKVNCAVFISGTGTNLNCIIKNAKKKFFPIKVSLVISNKSDAFGLNYAKKNNIPTKVFSSLNMKSFEKKTLEELRRKKIKFICLAGFMKILSKKFIKKFGYNIINIHPSLLPKYKGLNTHFRVLKNKEKISGCTVHYISSKLDSGKIILQKKVKVKNNDTSISLQRRILKQEHILYPEAIKTIFS
jgi:formyltetrahydrofolate-dependent phosphoribosylglycinamide formyltransferase|tara:strand:- start:653 stop:1228 length:576 start_codon:yes stop_codon:yes gene_type:complete